MSSNNRQIILPVAIGLSLCGISAYFMYLYLKRNKDDDYLPKTSHNRTFELKISKDICPALIGRGGSNIKEIQEKSGCRINFTDQQSDEEERTCILRGDEDSIHMAELLIQECIANLALIEVEEMWVPQTACGRIIGRCGENIQKIMRSSNTRIDLDNTPREEENGIVMSKLSIKGTPDQIAVAKSLIEARIAEDAEIRQNLAQRKPRGPPKISPSPSPTPPKKEDKVMVKHFNEKFSESGQIDGRIEVYVSAVEDPGKFWVQIVGPKATELDQLVDQMTEYYSKEENASLHRLNEVSVGEIVAAQFAFDKKWYRAEVTKIMRDLDSPQKEVVDLYFVDYGDTSVVNKNEVYELRTDFLRLRFQAIECFLATIEPAEGAEWSEEAIELFEGLTQVAQWKKLWSKVIRYKERNHQNVNDRSKREGSPIPGIKLYDTSKDSDVDIAGELVKAGFAVYEADSKPLASASISPTSPTSPTPPTSTVSPTSPTPPMRAISEPKVTIIDTPRKDDTRIKKSETVDTPKVSSEIRIPSPASNNNITDNVSPSVVAGKSSKIDDIEISLEIHNGNDEEIKKFQEISRKNGNVTDEQLVNNPPKPKKEDVKSFLENERFGRSSDTGKQTESINVKKPKFEKKLE